MLIDRPTAQSSTASGRLSGLLGTIYGRITGNAPSARVQGALDQFPFYAIGSVAARGLSLLAQLFVARAIGPEQFGRFGLTLGIALMLTFPLQEAWGAAFVRFAAIRPAGTSPWSALRAAITLALATSAAVATLAGLGTPFAVRWLDLPREVYGAGIATSVAATVWFVARFTCQGVHAWRRLVAIDLGWAILITALPILAYARTGALDWTAIGFFAVAYVVAAAPVVPLWFAKPDHPVAPQVRMLWHFGKYLAVASALNAFLFYGDRLIVNHAAGLHAAGVYQAYALSTMSVAGVTAQLVNRFLFPFLNLGDRSAFRRLFRLALPWVAAVFLPITFFSGALIVTVLDYPFQPLVLAIAAVAGLAVCVTMFLNALIATDDVRGPRVVMTLNATTCAIFFPLALVLIRWFPLAAPFVAYAVALSVSATLAYAWLSARAPTPATAVRPNG